MRRLFLCFLLCLMPLRLWAGVWMPMAQSPVQHGPHNVKVTQQSPADAAHDCHESSAKSGHHAALETPPDTAAQKTDCHDGTCQLCGVCHQSAGLATWPVLVPIFQAHALPLGVSVAHVARAAPPLIKPPIF